MGQREQNLGSAKVCWHFAYERQQDVFYKQKLLQFCISVWHAKSVKFTHIYIKLCISFRI